MTFDLQRGVTVLFGDRNATMADTWEWDGTVWRPIATPVSPPALVEPSLVFDFTRGRVVLTGASRQTTGTGLLAYETWEYDGATWVQLGSEPVRWSQGSIRAVFDMSRSRIVGYDGGVVREWTTQRADVSEYGVPCGSAPPRLLPRARPRVGERAGIEVVAAPGQLVALAMSASQGSLALPGGCTVLLGPVARIVLAFADAGGNAQADVPVPLVPALRGRTLFAQAAALAPATALGFELSGGLQLLIGD